MSDIDAQIANEHDRQFRVCGNCEYFDAIGQTGLTFRGDCHNSHSPRFTTLSNDTCDQFHPTT